MFYVAYLALHGLLYYLAAARRTLREAPFQALLATLRSRELAAAVAALPGYDIAMAGTRETLTAALAWLEPPQSRRKHA